MSKVSIALLLLLVLGTWTYAMDDSLRVAGVHMTVVENVLTDAPLDAPNPIVQSNGYRGTTFYPGARIADYTVSSVDLNTRTVVISNGTSVVNLVVFPGIHTNRTADVISISTHTAQRVAVGDQLADGMIISEITTNEAVIAESASTGQITIPRMTDEEREELKKSRPQPSGPVYVLPGAAKRN